VLGRINVVVAACQNGDSSGCKAGMMGGGVDPASQTGRYRKTGFAELARNLLRELQSGSLALREPTTATMGCVRTTVWPRTAINGGASSIICRRAG